MLFVNSVIEHSVLQRKVRSVDGRSIDCKEEKQGVFFFFLGVGGGGGLRRRGVGNFPGNNYHL